MARRRRLTGQLGHARCGGRRQHGGARLRRASMEPRCARSRPSLIVVLQQRCAATMRDTTRRCDVVGCSVRWAEALILIKPVLCTVYTTRLWRELSPPAVGGSEFSQPPFPRCSAHSPCAVLICCCSSSHPPPSPALVAHHRRCPGRPCLCGGSASTDARRCVRSSAAMGKRPHRGLREQGRALQTTARKQQRRLPDSGVVYQRKAPRNPRSPYYPHHRLLLLGEGNFSFAHSLIASPPSRTFAPLPPSHVVATCYDSFQQTIDKYPVSHTHPRPSPSSPSSHPLAPPRSPLTPPSPSTAPTPHPSH